MERLQLYLSPDKPLTAQERSGYRTAIQKRRGGMPLQHIIGEVSFFGLTFRVNGDTLVPRPETEELLDHTLKLTPRNQDITCLDLGTGSGAIAVCLARYLPRASVVAADISEKALALAKENAARNGVRDRVVFVQSDWFENVRGRFDFIASNPPYISEEEWLRLPTDVKDHEPRVALDGGIGGIEQLAAIAESVMEHLNPDGRVLFEIGATQGKAVADMLDRAGLIEIRIERDLAGKERFAIARCPS